MEMVKTVYGCEIDEVERVVTAQSKELGRIRRSHRRRRGVLPLGENLGMFLQEINRIPQLGRQEEADLAKAVQRGKSAAARVEAHRSGTDFLDEEELVWLSKQIRAGKEARNQLVETNLRVVVMLAKQYYANNLSLTDLIQEGTFGLLESVENFDPTKGCKFSTYAKKSIKGKIVDLLSRQGAVELPEDVFSQILSIKRAQDIFYQEHGRTPSIEELAAKMGGKMSVKVIERRLAQMQMRETGSLDVCVGDEDDGVTVGDLVEDKMQSPLETVNKRLLSEDIARVLSGLKANEHRVISKRYGLDGAEPMGSTEVAKELKMSVERVRKIESEALNKLRTQKTKDLLFNR